MAAVPPPSTAVKAKGASGVEASPDLAMSRSWVLPTASSSLGDLFSRAHPLRVYNSLTRSKTPFIPIQGRRVLWYMCGPTVYDAAHMGHARTYLSFDILRRILTSYFNYDVTLCMNVTDIDDKIILRAREAGVTFDALAREHEASFLRDMDRLGVLPPNVMTRVSEYVPEVIAFINGIIAKGFAYASGGSVYFDTVAYRASPRHVYGKLVPENVDNKAAAEEGEGSLSLGAVDKRAACDFVLWKASKPGEPTWESPWGPGRPGWHIECSAMCGDTLGPLAGGRIDIHSGGIDLRFPHHDNEIAQSEACLGGVACGTGGGGLTPPQWVNYFVHSGHLNIEGLKMSKSLKNFIKIGDAVSRYGARALRLLFLLQRYGAPMSYSEHAMEAVVATDKMFTEFFAGIRARLRNMPPSSVQHWGARDKELAACIEAARVAVREALCDDFDTPRAMAALSELVRDVNRYLAPPPQGAPPATPPVPLVLRSAADFVSSMFRVFGLVDPLPGIGGGSAAAAGEGEGGVEGSGAGGDREATLAPVLDVLAAFRERVRDAARAGDTAALLRLCDSLRDGALMPLGVKLEDVTFLKPKAEGEGVGGTEGGAAAPSAAAAAAGAGGDASWTPRSSSWKLLSIEDVKREADERAAAVEEKAARKAAANAEAARKAAEKEARAQVDPRGMFRGVAPAAEGGGPLYSVWDAEGVPTHDGAGVELSKGTLKRLRKEWEAQERLFSTRAQ